MTRLFAPLALLLCTYLEHGPIDHRCLYFLALYGPSTVTLFSLMVGGSIIKGALHAKKKESFAFKINPKSIFSSTLMGNNINIQLSMDE